MFNKNKNKNRFLQNLLVFISFVGLVIVLAEIVLNTQNQSLCVGDACKFVHLFDMYNILNWIGLGLFTYLLFTSVMNLWNIFYIEPFLKLRILILTGAIVVEGYFIGFQTWFLGKFCYYCLFIAGCIFLFAIVDYFYQKDFEKLSLSYIGAFAGFLAIFIASFLVKVPLKPFPDTKNYILFFDKNCPHCKKVEEFLDEIKISYLKYPVSQYKMLLGVLNIEGVPVLLIKDNGKIVFLYGEQNIRSWFENKGLVFSQDLLNLNYLEKDFNGGVCDPEKGVCK